MDNLKVHKTLLIKNFCIYNKLNILFNCVYSPQLNPIEYFFAILKKKYANMEIKSS